MKSKASDDRMGLISHYSFVWDDVKALQNQRKHGIAFEEAVTVFDDLLAETFPDHENHEGEERWVIIGLTKRRTLVLVAHVFSDGNGGVIVRLISARKTTTHERRKYETNPYSIREPTPMAQIKTEKPYEIKEEYDIPPDAERGKFYSPNATRSWPIYLDHDVLKHFSELAWSRGIETRELLNEMLRRQMPATGSGGGSDYATPGELADRR
jgi:uncharacterized DUF497 family protein